MGETVIRALEVAKQFNIHKDKSLKERLVNFRRSRAHAEEFWALRGISFELAEGTTLGLIGHNGSGKSTLLKIVGGILSPTRGYVERRGRLAALLELGAGFHGDLTGRENVYLNASILGLTKRQTDAHFDEIVAFSGIEEFIDTQVKFYSSGMYVRLAFAVAVHVDPEILLVDEVLAVGDEPFQRKCLERIKRFQHEGRAIVFVTHALDQVRQMCDRVLLLERGGVVVDGSPLEALRTFRERYEEAADEDQAGAGNRNLEIRHVTVTDRNGDPASRFTAEDALAVELDLLAHEPTDDAVVGVAITNNVDVLVHGTNTKLLGIDLGHVAGSRHVRFVFPHLPLVEGQYFVTVAVHPGVGPEWHRLDRVAAFKVFSDVRTDGIVHMIPWFEMLPE